MVDDPSVEDKGGFEFASGMDIFSEPGVMKATRAMEEVTYGSGAAPANIPTFADDIGETPSRMYVTAGDKILESTDGTTFNLFLTNAEGDNLGLKIFDGYVLYAAASDLGRAPLGDGASKDDDWQPIDTDGEYHPMELQAGTLKIGAGRYITSVAEGGTVTNQALKLPSSYRVKSLTSHLSKLYMGTKSGAGGGASIFADASTFDWNGIPLSSGSALPNTHYPLKMRAMNALHSDGSNLYGFPDDARNVHIFTGNTFVPFRKLYSNVIDVSTVSPGGVCQYNDSILWSGEFTAGAGVFRMRNGAICQEFVPVGHAPGASGVFNIKLVKVAYNGVVYIGYYKGSDSSYHLARVGSSRQNGAFVNTLWHTIKTDRMKRWAGIKLNLEPLQSGCSVAVHFRTARNATFTDSGLTVTSSTQDMPVIFSPQPRAREIQFKLVYTTNGSTTPELLSYDPIFEVLNTMR